MKTWEERFFELNREQETELVGVCFSHVFRGLKALGWNCDDEFWAPDLQVSRFTQLEEELFVIQETYFAPKLTGEDRRISELRAFISGIDPNEDSLAGAPPSHKTANADEARMPIA